MRNISKILFWSLLPMALMLSHCSKSDTKGDDPTPPDGKKVTLSITTAPAPANKSRTSLQNDREVFWSEGDQVMVNGRVYPIVIDETDKTQATIPDVDASESYLASYVLRTAFWNHDGSQLVSYLPYDQQYFPGTFAPYNNPMAAYSTTTSLSFKNLCGIIRVAVTGEDTILQTISLLGNNDEAIAGDLLLPIDDLVSGIFTGQIGFEFMEPIKSITLDCGEGLALDASVPTCIYIVVPARTYTKGFSVTMTDTKGRTCIQTTTKSVTIDRAGIKDMEPFVFTPAEDIALDITAKTATSISYKVTAKANSPLRTLVVSKAMWDYYLNEPDFTTENLPSAILSQLGTTVTADASGVHTLTATKAQVLNGYAAISAATDYKILASYADGEKSVGKVYMQDVRTENATGTAPELDITSVETERPYFQLQFNFKTANAASVRCYSYEKDIYDQEIALGKTDSELLHQFGVELSPEDLAKANSAAGAERNFSGLTSNTTLVVLVMATGEGGMETIRKTEKTTPYYIDPAANWTVISTHAMLSCGIFRRFDIPMFDIPDLTVEKLDGKNIFRIADVFHTGRNPILAESGFSDITGSSEPCYLIIDATDTNAVKIEPLESSMGLLSKQYNLTFMHAFSIPLLIQGDAAIEYPFGTYNEQEGIIELYRLGIYCNQGIYGYSDPSRLYLNLQKEGAMSTENFKKDDTPTAW